jgi:aminopeptidase N
MSQGWPGLVFLSSYAFLTPEEATELSKNPLDGAMNRLTLPHEIAHQWWGDLVGWRTYRDQWISEALANYSALMMMETEKPGEVRLILERYREQLLEPNKNGETLRDAGPVSLGLRLNSSHFPNGYEAVSYGRGTWLLHMLRHMLLDAEAKQAGHAGHVRPESEEPFVRALRKVRERYAGRAITTHQLFAVFEEDLPRSLWYEGHKSLDWFVQGWVEGAALPHYRVQNVRFVKKASGAEVVGVIAQKDAPHDLVSAVPVFAVTEGKPLLLGTVLADGPETPFRFAVPAGTKKVVLDAYQTMLTSK